MNKRCFSVEKCELSERCEFAHTPIKNIVIFFYPRYTGESCDSYSPIEESDEDIERLKQLAGCLA